MVVTPHTSNASLMAVRLNLLGVGAGPEGYRGLVEHFKASPGAASPSNLALGTSPLRPGCSASG